MTLKTRKTRKTRCMEHRREDAALPEGSYMWCYGCGEWEKRAGKMVKVGIGANVKDFS